MTHEPGTILYSFYEVVELIGSGGMGAVYKARDRRDGTTVAIKQMHDQGGAGFERPEMRERFDKEWRTLRNLNHPRIPAMIDAFREGDSGYYVMEYIEGHRLDVMLKDLLKQGRRFPETLLLEYALQILDVLTYLHGLPKPLVHRDVKPQNLIVRSSDGEIVLVDYGLARNTESATTKTLVGTLGYAPLEQVKGHPEPRSDLYALGATMFHLLTGEQPSPFDVPPLEKVRNDIHPLLAEIVNRACQDNPNRRYASAAKMELAVRQALSTIQGLPPDSEYERLYEQEGEIVVHEAPPAGPMSTGAFFFNLVLGSGLVLSLLIGLSLLRNHLNQPGRTTSSVSSPVPAEFVQHPDPGTQPAPPATNPAPAGQPYELLPPSDQMRVMAPPAAVVESLPNLGAWSLRGVLGQISPGLGLDANPGQQAGLLFLRSSPATVDSFSFRLSRPRGPASVQIRFTDAQQQTVLAFLSFYIQGQYHLALEGPGQASSQPQLVLPESTALSMVCVIRQGPQGCVLDVNGNETALNGCQIANVSTLQVLVPAARQAQSLQVLDLSIRDR